MCMGLTFCCYLPVHVPRCDSAWEPPWCSVPNTSTKSGHMLWGEDPVAAWTMENEIKRQLWAPQWRENTLVFYPKIKGKMKLSTRSPFDKKLKEFLPSWATKRLPSAVSTICSICFFTKRWVLGLVVTARKRSLRRLCFYRCLSFCPRGGHVWLLQGGVHGSSGGGHAWLLWGGMCGCSRGCAWLLWGVACVVAPGGMCGCSGRGGMHGCSRGACVVAPGGHAWLLQGGMHGCSGGGGMRGCSRGRGHAWLLWGGGHAWLLWGACMVAPGGMRGCSWGACMVAPGGACMVAPRGHVWLLWGRGHAWFFWWDTVN